VTRRGRRAAALTGLILGAALAAPAAAGHGAPPVPLRWLSAAELKALLESGRRAPVHLVDLRPAQAFREGHVPGARSMPLAELGARAREIPPGQIVLYCDCSAHEIESAYNLLWNLGWNDVRALADGLGGWRARGYPVAR
jgi:rhodanese-related sulfurtransferase